MNGFAVRVPMPTGSLVDLTIEAEGDGDHVRRRSTRRSPDTPTADAPEGILAYTEDPIVSSDIVKSSYSSIFDAASDIGRLRKKTQVKVIAWYDNEWGYSEPARRTRRARDGARRPDRLSEHAATARRAGPGAGSGPVRLGAAPDEFAALAELLDRGARELHGRVIWNVNSTAKGGGVVELLRPLLGYSRGSGVDARWVVSPPIRSFSRSQSGCTTTSTASLATAARWAATSTRSTSGRWTSTRPNWSGSCTRATS